MDDNAIKYFVESALLAAGRPLSIDHLQRLFDDDSAPEKTQIRQAISNLLEDYEERGITITEVASGFRMQIEGNMVERLQKLWEERPPKYSRAMLETLALIAYRQPLTRGDIEEIRGVSVSTNIIRSLLEREWVRIVGHRDVPGRPALFATTRTFLDYFNLRSLDELPPLSELRDLTDDSDELDLATEPPEIRSLELAVEEMDPTLDEQQQDDLDSVSKEVAAIQENIRLFVQEDAHEDDAKDDADPDYTDTDIPDSADMDAEPADVEQSDNQDPGDSRG